MTHPTSFKKFLPAPLSTPWGGVTPRRVPPRRAEPRRPNEAGIEEQSFARSLQLASVTTVLEYAEMHYYYGVAKGNGLLAARLYQEQLQRRGKVREHYPDNRVFINTHNTLMASQILEGNREGIQRVDPDRRDMVLEEVENRPFTSSRKITRRNEILRT
ncbi:unnamed protein product [Diatraea saccharalis]|uniref:DUF4817 domain-containing protein n=1 Tax=Diatraea saccharalis TaxID=40085 RepID=A0A9N9RDT2_9NEOP|nr:unnamed protein product [Diatraea saccharalis]